MNGSDRRTEHSTLFDPALTEQICESGGSCCRLPSFLPLCFANTALGSDATVSSTPTGVLHPTASTAASSNPGFNVPSSWLTCPTTTISRTVPPSTEDGNYISQRWLRGLPCWVRAEVDLKNLPRSPRTCGVSREGKRREPGSTHRSEGVRLRDRTKRDSKAACRPPVISMAVAAFQRTILDDGPIIPR